MIMEMNLIQRIVTVLYLGVVCVYVVVVIISCKSDFMSKAEQKAERIIDKINKVFPIITLIYILFIILGKH